MAKRSEEKQLIAYMQSQGWLCMKLGASKFAPGWPDYYCYHQKYGHRWLEMKSQYEKLTKAQKYRFDLMSRAGDKIFVCHSKEDYITLFEEIDNWRKYT